MKTPKTFPVIVTRYHGPTDTRGSRISATSGSGRRIYCGYRHELSATENHETAAAELAAKLWPGATIGGGGEMPGRSGARAQFVTLPG
jgi:hypothetical protein